MTIRKQDVLAAGNLLREHRGMPPLHMCACWKCQEIVSGEFCSRCERAECTEDCDFCDEDQE